MTTPSILPTSRSISRTSISRTGQRVGALLLLAGGVLLSLIGVLLMPDHYRDMPEADV